MKKQGWYWLIRDDEKSLVYYYQNPNTDEWGFGFNIKDGGGFLPADDITEATEIIEAEVK